MSPARQVGGPGLACIDDPDGGPRVSPSPLPPPPPVVLLIHEEQGRAGRPHSEPRLLRAAAELPLWCRFIRNQRGSAGPLGALRGGKGASRSHAEQAD